MDAQLKEKANSLCLEIGTLKAKIRVARTELSALSADLSKIQDSCPHENQKKIPLGMEKTGPSMYFCEDCKKFLGQF